jgi:hypothetical protein
MPQACGWEALSSGWIVLADTLRLDMLDFAHYWITGESFDWPAPE